MHWCRYPFLHTQNGWCIPTQPIPRCNTPTYWLPTNIGVNGLIISADIYGRVTPTGEAEKKHLNILPVFASCYRGFRSLKGTIKLYDPIFMTIHFTCERIQYSGLFFKFLPCREWNWKTDRCTEFLQYKIISLHRGISSHPRHRK